VRPGLLNGLRVLVTRAEDQADSYREQLEDAGAQVAELSVICIKPAGDYSALDAALQNISSYQWIVFASQNAVNYTWARLTHLGLDKSCLEETKIASIGPATSQLLTNLGLSVVFQPSVFVAETFVSEFPAYPDLAGTRILWPKTNIGRRLIAEQLQAAGAQVDNAIAYETALPDNAGQVAEKLMLMLEEKSIDVITLASAQTAKNLALLIDLALQQKFASGGSEEEKSQAKKTLLAKVKIAAIGPITAAAATESLGRVDIVADKHTLDGLTEALLASLKFPQNQQ